MSRRTIRFFRRPARPPARRLATLAAIVTIVTTGSLAGPAAVRAADAPAPGIGAAPAGDAARGRRLLQQRQVSGCILCHRIPGLPAGGALGPSLEGLAARYSAAALRERIADARRFNPQTIMPPYLSTEGLHNVARAQQGQTVLDEAAVADIVAYLLGAPADRDERR